MIRYFTKTILRYIFVMISFPIAASAFFLRLIALLPGFNYKVLRNYSQIIKIKEELRNEGKSVGHAVQSKTVGLFFNKWQLLNLTLKKGESLTAEHFFLNRPLDDVKLLLQFCKDYVTIAEGDLIFDPGCGTGKHLFYLTDRYNCQGIGVDVYRPAINVAKRANFDNHVTFFNKSMIDFDSSKQVLPSSCDYIFINSWLNHVYMYPGYNLMIEKLLKSCRFMLVINSVKFELESLIPNAEILVFEIHDNAQYALIKGKV